uniref:Minor structural protein n=4 Tax=Parvovirinae TaxID=40119 RepID=A0A3G2LVC1_9VIRU|nr:minor structural protein [Chimpanzee parv4]
MSAADAYRPGGKLPLDELMQKMNRAVPVGPEPSQPANRGGGSYQTHFAIGIVYSKAFQGLLRFANALPAELSPVKQLVNQLEVYRRKTSDTRVWYRVYLDMTRLLISVAPLGAANKLRQAAANISHTKAPNAETLRGIVRFAAAATVPTVADIDSFFQDSLTDFSNEDLDTWQQLHEQFIQLFHPPDVGVHLVSDSRDEGPDSIVEPDLERPAGGGLTLPGYNYVGPGNPLDSGPPQGPVDEAAKHHDERYAEMIEHGDIPYLHGHGADRLMNKELEEKERRGDISHLADVVVGNAIRGIWQAKETVGDIADVQLSQVLPPAPPTSDQQPAYSAGEPSPKKARTGTLEESETPVLLQPNTNTMSVEPAGGGGGVKVKAQWVGGTSFSDSLVITSHTRTSMLADRGGYVPVYKQGSHLDSSQPVMGMKTPYSYIDVNALSAHFTPRDFQQLLDEYDEIRPKSLTIAISAIVIKDVATNQTGTTVSDSASGGITIFADDSYDYPYVLGHNQDTLPGHLPGENYVLPQYGYITRGREIDQQNNIVAISDHKTELFFLEHHDAECLGTGDHWSHSYEFPNDLPWRKLSTPNQTLYARHNPIPASRLAIMTGVDNDGTAIWKRPEGMDVGRLPLNHIPGPALMMPTDTQIRNTTFRDPVAIGNPATSDRYSVAPLVHQPWSVRTEEWLANKTDYAVHNYLGAVAYTRRKHEESYEKHTEDRDGRVTNPSKVIQVDGDLAAPHVGHTFFVPGHTRVTSGGTDTVYSPKLYQEPVFPLLPGAVWNPNPLSYDCQIWTKIPNTECHFFAQYPLLGGWGVHTPPPMIFIKLRSQPGPPSAGAHTVPQSNLNQYAIFHLHYSMQFEVKRRKRSRRHNPEKPAPFPSTDSGRMPFTLANSLTDPNTPVYEVPSNQWVARNYSHLL